MKTFSDKVKEARAALRMTQSELAEKTEVSSRAIQTYEQGEKRPRQGTMLKLAKALGVSAKYLSDDSCENPLEEIEKDTFFQEARRLYGAPGARDVDSLLDANSALFAGGDLSQEEKDAFFEAVMKAYIVSKDLAKEKFGRKETND